MSLGARRRVSWGTPGSSRARNTGVRRARSTAGSSREPAVPPRELHCRMPSRLRPWLAPAVLAASAILLHLACAGRYGFFRDELYFVACGKRLAWGYVDHPPLSIALLALQRDLFVAGAELATNPDAWDRLRDSVAVHAQEEVR